jgi:hypothetical protein
MNASHFGITHLYALFFFHYCQRSEVISFCIAGINLEVECRKVLWLTSLAFEETLPQKKNFL